MPQAFRGKASEECYTFVINASVDAVRLFYEGELPNDGWAYLGSFWNVPQSSLLTFKKDERMIFILVGQDEGLPNVLIGPVVIKEIFKVR